MTDYTEFLREKIKLAKPAGFEVSQDDMTVPYRAILLGRYGMASELSEEYFRDGVRNLMLADSERSIPSLFDMERAVND